MNPIGDPDLTAASAKQPISVGVAKSATDVSRWQQEEQLSKVEQLVSKLRELISSAPGWEPFIQARALEKRLGPELERPRFRVDSVLVVGFVGGTGVGKSTLINALLGERVCTAGELRPTTTNPHIVCGTRLDISFLRLDEEKPQVHCRPLPMLQNMMFIDCPDPDTQEEGDSTNRNLDALQQILPACDVLIWVATAQKYRSQRVTNELLRHSPGRCLVFVQTHASQDTDVRHHWLVTLRDAGFAVEKIFRIDSEEALNDGLTRRPIRQYEFVELKHLLEEQLANRARLRIQRSNVVELCLWLIAEVSGFIVSKSDVLSQLKTTVIRQQSWLDAKVRPQTRDVALAATIQSRRHILNRVLQRWSWGPFAAFVRIVSGIRGLLPWLTLTRARSLTQLAVAGTFVAADAAMRAWASMRAQDPLWEPGNLGISARDVAQARDICEAVARDAGLKYAIRIPDGEERNRWNEEFLNKLTNELNRQADSFIDHEVSCRVRDRANVVTHVVFELCFAFVPSVALYRLGRNFFYEHLWLGQAVMPWDFALYGLVWTVGIGLLLQYVLVAICGLGLKYAILERMNAVNDEAFRGLAADLLAEADVIEQYKIKLSELNESAIKLRSELEFSEVGVGTLAGQRPIKGN